jgi:methylphosphotriester-DNA--protein-cysteine methyltransferase
VRSVHIVTSGDAIASDEGSHGVRPTIQALTCGAKPLRDGTTFAEQAAGRGSSFRDVVDDARHQLAAVYLGDRTLSMTDVACLLGYSEAAAFTRAYKRWIGSAPSQARR